MYNGIQLYATIIQLLTVASHLQLLNNITSSFELLQKEFLLDLGLLFFVFASGDLFVYANLL